MYFEINKKIAEVKIKISQRDSLLKGYQAISKEIQALGNRKQNYSKLLVLIKEQEAILKKLEENSLLNQVYLDLISEKEKLIEKSAPERTKEINLINQKLDKFEKRVSMVSESLTAARELLNELLRLGRELRKARSEGIRGLLRMQLFTTHTRHSHIKEAKNIVNNIKKISNRYQTELKDIESKEDLGLKLNNFETSDIFIDNFITDWNVIFKSHRMLKQSTAYENIFEKQVELLEEKEAKISLELNDLKLKRMEMIEKI